MLFVSMLLTMFYVLMDVFCYPYGHHIFRYQCAVAKTENP